MAGSNRRLLPYKGDALPTNLIYLACWSFIIGIVQSESMVFKMIAIVQHKISHGAIIIASNAKFCLIVMRNQPQRARN